MQEPNTQNDFQTKQECYKCKRLATWYFSCLSIFFTVTFFKCRPYSTWTSLLITLTPAAGFSGGAFYSHLQAEEIKAKLINNNL